jgi:hypothetical protein
MVCRICPSPGILIKGRPFEKKIFLPSSEERVGQIKANIPDFWTTQSAD